MASSSSWQEVIVLRVAFRILRATSSSLSFIVSVSVLTALILSLPVMWFWPFGRTHHPTVDIDDRASILSDESVTDNIGVWAFVKMFTSWSYRCPDT